MFINQIFESIVHLSGTVTARSIIGLNRTDPRFALSGRIEFDGIAADSVALDALRRRIALVSQDTYLFNASLAENIRLARPDASDADRAATASELVNLVAGRLHAHAGERLVPARDLHARHEMSAVFITNVMFRSSSVRRSA